MDTNVEIREEDPLSDNVVSQYEEKFEYVTTKTNSNSVLLSDGCDVPIKTEIKSETPFPYFSSEEEREYLTKHNLNQSRSETLTSINNCEIASTTEIGEQALGLTYDLHESEFLPEHPIMDIQKCGSDHEMDNKVEIKVEPYWQEAETLSVCDEFKEEDSCPLKSSRLCMEVVSGDTKGKSLLRSAEDSGREINFYDGKDCPACESQGSNVTRTPIVEDHDHSEQCGKCSNGREIYGKSLYLKQNNLNHEGKRTHKCNIYMKSTHVLHLKSNESINDCDRPLQHNSSHKSIIDLPHLKLHTLIHEGKKPYQCKTCDKRFTQLSNLKTHTLIHEGKKPHQCKTCDKRFTQLSQLRSHNLIHEGKKPYKCKTCDKRFTQLSHLNSHNLIHEGKKPYHCKTCDKSFTNQTNLNMHNLIHEGKKPHQCKSCNKAFTRMASLKNHNLIHEGEKPQCKTCGKSFYSLSNLKKHNLIHEGTRAHKCNTCDKSFTTSSNLKMHNFIHEGKKPHQCKNCDKSFITFSKLKRHNNLMHEHKKPHQS